MKIMRFISTCLFITLIGSAATSRAEDIDIYSGTTANGAPNIMFVIDNAANSNASGMGACTYAAAAGGGAPAEDTKSLGSYKCALANIVAGMPPLDVGGDAVVRLGIVTKCGVLFPLTDIDNKPYPAAVGAAVVKVFCTNPNDITYTIPQGSTNKQAFILAVRAIIANAGLAAQGAQLQETWAYYTGGNDGSGSTGTGILSGTAHAGTNAINGCQKNYVIFLSGVTSSSHGLEHNSHTEDTKLHSATANAVANTTLTAAQKTTLDTVVTPSLESGFAREWARFMRATDVNTTAAPADPLTDPPEGTGLQSIVTYSVATGATAVPPTVITDGMEKYIKAISTYGGGKYYPAGNDSSVVTSSILKILNEVQAVNSVFSSSSLPVSVNAQGTYLNQIYMGMFRPDPDGNPRWMGNLKQYHFIATRDAVTNLVNLSMGDSIDASAINPATGFISPNAISFWTCTNMVDNPYSLTAAQQTLLTDQNQSCTDPTGGFWINDAQKVSDSAGGAYDFPDGEWVDKGGAAQRVRYDNLADDYADAAGYPPAIYATNPRQLYTCTGACATGDSLSSYLFANSNASLTDASFGIVTPVGISSLTRSGSTAYVTTAAAHGVTDGQLVQVSGANQSEYNGSFVMTVTSPNTVTYTTSVSPASPATGTITATLPGATLAITSLTRVGTTVTVSAAGNTLVDGGTVTLSGVTPTDYNGNWTVSCAGSCNPTFTFTVPAEGPVTPSGGGSAAVPSRTTRTIASIDANPAPGLVRTGTLVTVKTTANHGFDTGDLVTIAGADDSDYNIASRAIIKTGTKEFTYTLPCTTPCTPASVLGTASVPAAAPVGVDSLTMVLGAGAAGTVTATTTLAHGLVGTPTISISGAAQSEYNGTVTATVTGLSTFTYQIITAPATPATGTMTLGSNVLKSSLINWVRGEDNVGDEFGPGGTTTIRPSLHGDVLHSRPVTVNYGSPTIAITAVDDSGDPWIATASTADVAILAAAGVSPGVKFANGDSCIVSVASTTEFTYSATGCGAAGAQTATSVSSSNVVVFYGGNDGVFRAVNGNQTAPINTAAGAVPAGSELWGFVPTEFFSTLRRQHDNSPILDLPSTIPGISPAPQKKNYFADGSSGIYQKLNADGSTNTAYLYISMRRGGRLLYALNITDPAIPKYLWKITNTGDFTELGQTWSAPKVALIKGYNDGSGNAKPVVIFGAGYATTQDTEPAGTDAMGRGIYIVDAVTGALVWRATYGASSACTTITAGVKATCTVLGMDYSIPSDITLIDQDSDGYIDRLYTGDVGGNVWRVDLQREGNITNNTPGYWRVNQVASLGGGATKRKFFYAPDVVPAGTYDAIIVGSGDREHPLIINTAAADKQNRIFMLKDIPGDDGSGLTTITKSDLFDATSTAYDPAAASYDSSLSPNMGYFIDLLDGEKVVNAPLTVAGYTYLGTNQPTSLNSCSANLGVARGYRLNPFAGTYTSVVFAGGGLPPSPVAGVVSVTVEGESQSVLVPFIIGGGGDPDCVGADCSSALGGGKPTISVPTSRSRTYWYQEID